METVKPDYMTTIDEVAKRYSGIISYEQRLLNAWTDFESAASVLMPIPYDVLHPQIDVAFLAKTEEFINLLYQNDDASATPQSDCDQIREKDAAYGGSWHKRGGTGAFHAFARKGDRLVSMFQKHKSLAACRKDKTNSESIDDTIGDLRRYLILMLAWHEARPKMASKPVPHVFVARTTDRFSGPREETCEYCGTDPRNGIHEVVKQELVITRSFEPADEEPPKPRAKICDCSHPQAAHDDDGCNDFDPHKGMCSCRHFSQVF